MDPVDLDYFTKVAEAGGIREAARLLNIAPSAISRRITRLESSLSTKLLERTASGTALTATGRRVLTYIHEVTSARHRLLQDLEHTRLLEVGHVYISCTEGQLDLLSRATTAFQKQFPKIGFDINIGSAQAVLVAVEHGKADLGIAFSPSLHPPLESAVHIDAPLLAITTPDHPLSASTLPISVLALQPYPLALPPADFAIRRLFDKVANEVGLKPNIAICTDSISAMKSFVRNHESVTILSYMSVTTELKNGTLVGIPFEHPLLKKTQIKVCVLGRRRLPPAVSAFLRYLRTSFKERVNMYTTEDIYRQNSSSN